MDGCILAAFAVGSNQNTPLTGHPGRWGVTDESSCRHRIERPRFTGRERSGRSIVQELIGALQVDQLHPELEAVTALDEELFDWLDVVAGSEPIRKVVWEFDGDGLAGCG